MTKIPKIFYGVLLALLICHPVTVLSKEPFDLLDIVPGKAHPGNVNLGSSNQIPMLEYLSPLPSDSKFTIFHYYSVQMLESTDLVYAIQAKRPYKNWEKCKSDYEVLKNLIITAKPTFFYDTEQYAFRSPDLDISIHFGCMRAPYYVMDLRVSSKSATKLLYEKLEHSESKKVNKALNTEASKAGSG